jgi:Rv2632c-like
MTFTMSSEETDMLKATNENKVWTLEIAIGENSDETEAQARLSVGDTEMVGWGRARRNPHDPARPRVGEELAVARALSDLSHRLLDAAVTEIEEFEGQPVHLEGRGTTTRAVSVGSDTVKPWRARDRSPHPTRTP